MDDGPSSTVRFDLQRDAWGRDQYEAAHIPSAVYAHLSQDLSAPMTGLNGRHPWPSASAMTATFSSMGIGPDTQVVVYDQDVGMFGEPPVVDAPTMGTRGRRRARRRVGQGGCAKGARRAAGTSRGRRPPFRREATPRDDCLMSENVIAAREALLVDARAPGRFAGLTRRSIAWPGHIPVRAIVSTSRTSGADGTFRDARRAARRVRAALRMAARPIARSCTADRASPPVTTCSRSSMPACRVQRLYPGSWSDGVPDPSRTGGNRDRDIPCSHPSPR
jgi:thiosulfate/3-mercaptopyruvate sulfurtransferase